MKTLILLLFPFVLLAQPRLMQDSTFATTKAGSNQVTVLYDPGFKVGDIILIPTTVNRGSVGVGGSWPGLIYSTLAEMNASVKPDGIYAGCLEDGNNYRMVLGAWQPYKQWTYYTEKIVPIGLRAKIIDINGLVLTLDKSAQTSVSNVPVYYDNSIYLNQVWNWRDDFRLNQGVNHSFTFPKGRYAIGDALQVQQTFLDTAGHHEIDGNGSTVFSPSGFPSASIAGSVANLTIHDLSIEGNFKDNGFGFKWDFAPGINETRYYENPYEQLPGLMLNSWNGLAYNIHVKNTPGYALQVWRNSFIRNSSIVLEDGIRAYNGWQMLAIAGVKGAGFRKISFYSPYICNAMEAARSTDVIFDSITIINGMVAFNSTGGTRFTNSTITWTNREGSFINNGHPMLDINGYMAMYDGATNHLSLGGLIENVHFIQECTTNEGDILRAISAGDGIMNFTIKNSSYTRPNFTNVHSNQQAIFFGEALNNTIDGFEIKGIHTLPNGSSMFRSDITMGGAPGTGMIKNVKGAGSIYTANGVTVENSPLVGISNQLCNVLAWEPDNRDTITRTETVLLFPNPATNFINIKTKEDGLVTVYNTVGQQVNVSKTFNGQFIKINIKHLPSGLYFVHVERKRQYPIKQKFLKQNGRN